MAVAVLRLLQREAPGFFSDFEIYTADDRREAARIAYHKVVSRGRRSAADLRSIRAHKENHCAKNFRVRILRVVGSWHFSCALASSSRHATHFSQIETPGGATPRTTNRDWMTRIGFAYNQKPESTVGLVSASDVTSRARTKSLPPPASTTFIAEWDSADTIDAVATALSRLRRRDPPRGDAKTSPNASAPSAPTSSSTSPKDCTARIARPTSRRSASSSTFRTRAATRSRSRSACTRRRRRTSSRAHGIPNAPFALDRIRARPRRAARESTRAARVPRPASRSSSSRFRKARPRESPSATSSARATSSRRRRAFSSRRTRSR